MPLARPQTGQSGPARKKVHISHLSRLPQASVTLGTSGSCHMDSTVIDFALRELCRPLQGKIAAPVLSMGLPPPAVPRLIVGRLFHTLSRNLARPIAIDFLPVCRRSPLATAVVKVRPLREKTHTTVVAVFVKIQCQTYSAFLQLRNLGGEEVM